jgi:hypothetical protein
MGWITFNVAKAARVSEAQYSLGGGGKTTMVIWRLAG